ncbi:BolA-like protein 3 [Camelus dromedarius]|uniref:BolA-like protein 3 n=1 Tax=Camelus dromedarius TaxID=9838 RepID=A0A5N4D7H9_CAMDR|nr:BolA-like protein 3 [Camelus dromedarius]
MAAWSPAAAAASTPRTRGLPLLHCAKRVFASQTEGELKVTQILKEKFPRATAIKVTDISESAPPGIGVLVTRSRYRLVYQALPFVERVMQARSRRSRALKEEIKGMHGLRIFTSVPKH